MLPAPFVYPLERLRTPTPADLNSYSRGRSAPSFFGDFFVAVFMVALPEKRAEEKPRARPWCGIGPASDHMIGEGKTE